MNEETRKRMEEACTKAGWTNGPGHCEGVAFSEGYTAAHNDAQGVTSKLLHAEDALWSIVQSHGYKLTAEFALTLANEYFKKFKDTPYKELDDAQGEIEKLKAENAELKTKPPMFVKMDPVTEQLQQSEAVNATIKSLYKDIHALRNSLDTKSMYCDQIIKENRREENYLKEQIEKLESQLTLERAASAELSEMFCDLYTEKFENRIAWPGDSFHDFLGKYEVLLEKTLAAHHARQKERG